MRKASGVFCVAVFALALGTVARAQYLTPKERQAAARQILWHYKQYYEKLGLSAEQWQQAKSLLIEARVDGMASDQRRDEALLTLMTPDQQSRYRDSVRKRLEPWRTKPPSQFLGLFGLAVARYVRPLGLDKAQQAAMESALKPAVVAVKGWRMRGMGRWITKGRELRAAYRPKLRLLLREDQRARFDQMNADYDKKERTAYLNWLRRMLEPSVMPPQGEAAQLVDEIEQALLEQLGLDATRRGVVSAPLRLLLQHQLVAGRELMATRRALSGKGAKASVTVAEVRRLTKAWREKREVLRARLRAQLEVTHEPLLLSWELIE